MAFEVTLRWRAPVLHRLHFSASWRPAWLCSCFLLDENPVCMFLSSWFAHRVPVKLSVAALCVSRSICAQGSLPNFLFRLHKGGLSNYLPRPCVCQGPYVHTGGLSIFLSRPCVFQGPCVHTGGHRGTFKTAESCQSP